MLACGSGRSTTARITPAYKNRTGPALTFSPAEWDAFTAQVRIR
ncbi:DUF397 domain-containing protein [Nocardia goodfellowii]